jgi:hypothetical protein
MPKVLPLDERRTEYARLRATGLEPREAYGAAGYSLSIGGLKNRLAELEGNPKVIAKIKFFTRVALKHGNLSEKAQVAVKAQQFREAARAPAAERAEILSDENLKPTTKPKPLNETEIEQSLTELHSQAVAVGDLGTARQCLVDLGRNKGMFTPIQKIKFETVDDLSLEDTEALIKRLMAAKEAEAAQVPQNEEEDGTARVVQ